MKLLTFERGGSASWGALAGDAVADLGAATGFQASSSAGADALDRGRGGGAGAPG